MLYSNIGYVTPKAYLLMQLYVNVVTEILREDIYAAEVAGLKLSLSATHLGININVNGYSDKLMSLLQLTLETLANPVISSLVFYNVLNDLKNGFLGKF